MIFYQINTWYFTHTKPLDLRLIKKGIFMYVQQYSNNRRILSWNKPSFKKAFINLFTKNIVKVNLCDIPKTPNTLVANTAIVNNIPCFDEVDSRQEINKLNKENDHPKFKLAAYIEKNREHCNGIETPNISALNQSHKKDIIDCLKRVIVIGDSLSDSKGRMFAKTFGILPSAPQYHKGKFTNGFTWPEFLTSPHFMKHKTIDTQNNRVTYSPVTLMNKAEGGAVAGNYNQLIPKFKFISNMKKQINKIKFEATDLAIVSLGANDYVTFAKEDINKVIDDQINLIKKMTQQGAKNILVMGVPNLASTPFAKIQSSTYKNKMRIITLIHNIRLKLRLNKIASQEDINIKFFDLYKAMAEITKKAEELNLLSSSNIEGDTKNRPYILDRPFTKGYIGGTGYMDTAPNYLFNDSVHPTQEVHSIISMILNDFIVKEYQTKNNSNYK